MFLKFSKPLQFLMSKNAFVDLVPCAVSSETLLFPEIPMFGLALYEVSFKVNVNETKLHLLNVRKQRRTVGNLFYPPEPEAATRQKNPLVAALPQEGVVQLSGSGEPLEVAEDGRRHRAARRAPCGCPTQEGDVHRGQGGMGVRPPGFLVRNVFRA